MKKLVLLITILALALALVACGGAEPAAPVASTPAPAASASTSEAPAAESEELVYTLDYDNIASWVAAGMIGTDATGSPVVFAMDAAGESAIIIFGDNSDMTAVSFLGSITYENDLATITDETNGLALTFGMTQTAEDTLELDMGDVGTATVTDAALEEVLETIKNAIDNYTHVA